MDNLFLSVIFFFFLEGKFEPLKIMFDESYVFKDYIRCVVTQHTTNISSYALEEFSRFFVRCVDLNLGI